MPEYVQKVTAFITRQAATGHELLLLSHPYAGIQIPAGTVEPGEQPAAAVLREVAEETGLENVVRAYFLGEQEQAFPSGNYIVARQTPVYARPSTASFNWATLRSGIRVTGARSTAGFTQVTYREYDRFPDPAYITYQITGWVPQTALATATRRFFYHLVCPAQTEEQWTVAADNHQFTLFWAPLSALPQLVSPQDRWLHYLPSTRQLAGASA